MLHVKCPSCLHNLDLAEPKGDGPLTCPDCQARFDRTGQAIDPVPTAARHYPVVSSRPRNLTLYDRDLEDYEAEKQERRERRDFRRDVRDYRREEMAEHREDRSETEERNALAIVGLALSACAFLLVSSGLFFRLATTPQMASGFYLFFALFLGFPTAIAGLVVSFIGLLYRKVMQPLALIGVILAVLMVLGLIPAGFFVLAN